MSANKPNSKNSQPLNGLRVSEPEQKRILDELQAQSKTARFEEDHRIAQRYEMPSQLSVKLAIKHPGGTLRHVLVRARNISDTGIGIIYSGFIHNDTPCEIEICDGDSPLLTVPAIVARCRYLTNSVHEIGLRFGSPIESQSIIQAKKVEIPTNQPVRVVIPRLDGRLLYVEAFETERRYTTYRLTQMGLRVTHTDNALDALELAGKQAFDLILCEINLSPNPASYLIRRLRSKGNKTPIIVLGHSIEKHTAKEHTDLGAQACLNKPFTPIALSKALSQYLRELEPGQANKPPPGMPSEHWHDPGIRPLVTDFIREINPKVETLAASLLSSAADAELQTQVLHLACDASLYGYPKLGEAMNELLTVLNFDPVPQDIVMQQVIDLENLMTEINKAIA